MSLAPERAALLQERQHLQTDVAHGLQALPTADLYALPGDPARVVRGDKPHHVGDVGGLTEAPKGNRGDHLLGGGGARFDAVHRGVGQAGRDGVDGDAAAAELSRQQPREGLYAALAGA
jgi:hypothetical protein